MKRYDTLILAGAIILGVSVLRIGHTDSLPALRLSPRCQVLALFSDSPDTCAQFLGARFNGKAGVKRLYIGRFARNFAGGRNGPIHGFLLEHPQIQVCVNEDSKVDRWMKREEKN